MIIVGSTLFSENALKFFNLKNDILQKTTGYNVTQKNFLRRKFQLIFDADVDFVHWLMVEKLQDIVTGTH